ncbi:hypothetical protein IX332_000487 [Porphyromonas levii]|uniref:hypothetical protein n=1 Tax=Porphyromonas levii TaxID=28114 RepID=UPI001D9923AC|nr:hypothetical protein [Porphyromonas levii]MBR8713427.1 hypothetical protein [Porphyromonas levii]MBR8715436.1 hypothetical protein [Porphyromonas levii]MBR8727961.1 hypothetical protein [Porphyromonas levii]MBR8729176.1 hypothetical protein [Porphyromonas levii]MBR8736332.1 hypothetical protein [Porphyromonas levii]
MKCKFLISFVAILMVAMTTSCGKKEAPDDFEDSLPAKYDLWLAIGEGTSSTPKQDPHVVKKMPTLLEGEYDIRNKGAETAESKITPFVIYHKGYYYSLNRDYNFGKYKISHRNVAIVKQFPLNELSDRRFAHAWLDDKTLIMVGAPEDKLSVNWVKVDAEKMEVIAKGTLKFPEELGEKDMYSSCGLMALRRADNVLLYNYRLEDRNKDKSEKKPDSHGYFFTATIDLATMAVKHVEKETRAHRPGFVSFGSLRQDHGFFDAKGDYYMLCNTTNKGATSSSHQHGHILRIKAGEYKADPNFKIDIMEHSKIITMHHMKGSKLIVYLENPEYTKAPKGWKEPIRFFWAVVDLETKEQYRIEGIPFSQGGNYTQLIVVEKDYALLGISDKEQTKFYKFEYDSKKVTEAAKLKPGYFADRIIVLDE